MQELVHVSARSDGHIRLVQDRRLIVNSLVHFLVRADVGIGNVVALRVHGVPLFLLDIYALFVVRIVSLFILKTQLFLELDGHVELVLYQKIVVLDLKLSVAEFQICHQLFKTAIASLQKFFRLC